jgi:hypothetical protein
VKAPRSWPKTSLSISVSGIAAALTATNGPFGTRAQTVNGPGNELLSGTAFAGHDDGHVAARNHFYEVEDFTHWLARADKIAKQAFGFDIRSQSPRFAPQFNFALCVIEQRLEFGEVGHGLGQEVSGALFDRLNRHIDAAPRCNQQHRAAGGFRP